MKRFLILTALLAVLGLASCEKEPSKAIVGTWEAVKIEANVLGVNMSLTTALADTLDVSPQALAVPDIDSYIGLMHTLFTLEDRYVLPCLQVCA